MRSPAPVGERSGGRRLPRSHRDLTGEFITTAVIPAARLRRCAHGHASSGRAASGRAGRHRIGDFPLLNLHSYSYSYSYSTHALVLPRSVAVAAATAAAAAIVCPVTACRCCCCCLLPLPLPSPLRSPTDADLTADCCCCSLLPLLLSPLLSLLLSLSPPWSLSCSVAAQAHVDSAAALARRHRPLHRASLEATLPTTARARVPMAGLTRAPRPRRRAPVLAGPVAPSASSGGQAEARRGPDATRR